ncbi:5436_t:CDS:2, partial [Ambispora gerdemannii]
MNLWVDQINANTGLVLTDVLLKEKAHTFTEELGIDKEAQKFSNGWLEKFKKRNNIRKIMLHGEANSVLLALLPEARIILQAIISGYDLDNIYNVDETEITNVVQLTKDDIETDDNAIQIILSNFTSSDYEVTDEAKAYLRTIDEIVPTEEILDDNNIIALIKPQEENETNQESDNEIPPLITIMEAIESLQK